MRFGAACGRISTASRHRHCGAERARSVFPQRHRENAGGRGRALRDGSRLRLHEAGAGRPGRIPRGALATRAAVERPRRRKNEPRPLGIEERLSVDGLPEREAEREGVAEREPEIGIDAVLRELGGVEEPIPTGGEVVARRDGQHLVGFDGAPVAPPELDLELSPGSGRRVKAPPMRRCRGRRATGAPRVHARAHGR